MASEYVETFTVHIKATAITARISPEDAACQTLYELQKKYYAIAYRYTEGQPVNQQTLDETLDALHLLVLSMKVLAEERRDA